MDFSFANINALNTVFGENNIDILPCFFHLIKCRWRKCSELGFRKKNYILKTKILVMNLKLLAFMSRNKARDFYIKIKDSYEIEYESFFKYLEDT